MFRIDTVNGFPHTFEIRLQCDKPNRDNRHGRAVQKMRLDDLLFDRFQGLSKMYFREMVKRQLCEVNGRPENIGYQ